MGKKPAIQAVSTKPHKNAGKKFMHGSGAKVSKGKGC